MKLNAENMFLVLCLGLSSIAVTGIVADTLVRQSGTVSHPPMVLDSTRIVQINPSKEGKSVLTQGIRIELGLLNARLDPSDKVLGVIIVRNEEKKKIQAGVGDPEFCTVTVYYRLCRVVSQNPYVEQCYWMATHVEGKWNEKEKCCQVTVDGRKLCARGPIYQQF